MAAAYTLRSYLLLPLNLYWLRKYGGVPIKAQLSSLKGLAVATGIMTVAVIATKLVLDGHVRPIALLLIEVAVGVVTYLIALVMLERVLVRELAGLAMQVIPGSERIAKKLGLRAHLPPVKKPEDEEELEDEIMKDEDL